ncbi:MAG: carbon-nitrogen hydrolase family protein [Methanospirillaceae archaeon]|nr:carbon-nitrogen hydrolase family protein [Methanospirillaceae archaeon]
MNSKKRENQAFLFLVVSLVISLFVPVPAAGDGMAGYSSSLTNTTVRIAIFQMASVEGNFTANHATIQEAIRIASGRGADWFITPELAESGYAFVRSIRLEELPEFPSPWINSLESIAKEENITLFIGFPERDGSDYYNSVVVIDREGNVSAIHRKNVIIPGPFEEWATQGSSVPITVDDFSVGYFICADATDPTITSRYHSDDVDIFLSSAAWYPDPNMGPEQYWESITRISDAPLVIANTAGKKGAIDFTHAESGVYLGGEMVYRLPVNEQVMAFIDWNYLTDEITLAGEPAIVK